MNPEIVQSQSWRYKTIVVIKRQQQTIISNKQLWNAIQSVLTWGRITPDARRTQSEDDASLFRAKTRLD